jgi:negative regulator of flagellin synthesis FlgM
MPDPIQGINATQSLDVAQTGQPGSAAPTTGEAPARGAGLVDSADVARAEALLAAILNTAKGVPAIDQARVTELQNAIQSGAYQVNPQQIAEKIIEIEQLLATKGQ